MQQSGIEALMWFFGGTYYGGAPDIFQELQELLDVMPAYNDEHSDIANIANGDKFATNHPWLV